MRSKLFLVTALALFFSACSSVPKLAGGGAPDFYLSDQNGKTWDTTRLRDKTLLLDFWATWCVPCLQAIPDLNQFSQKHGDKITLIGVAIEDKGWELVKPAIAKHGINYPVVIGHPNLAKTYGVEGFPYLVLVKNGKIETQLLGKHSLADLEKELAAYIQ